MCVSWTGETGPFTDSQELFSDTSFNLVLRFHKLILTVNSPYSAASFRNESQPVQTRVWTSLSQFAAYAAPVSLIEDNFGSEDKWRLQGEISHAPVGGFCVFEGGVGWLRHAPGPSGGLADFSGRQRWQTAGSTA